MIAISLENVTKEFPGVLAVDDISFTVNAGCIHGFLGPNGAGKSTTMNIIAGLINSSKGKVVVNGSIGFLPEHPPLYEHMTVESYLAFVYDINVLSQVGKKQAVNSVLEQCKLLEVRKRIIGNLSKGFRQRVGIAQALVHSPAIVILDEPTVGLDPSAIIEIRSLISELSKNHTVLLSTHQLYEANLLCTHVTIIARGKIVESGPIEIMKKKFTPFQIVEVEVESMNAILEDKLRTELPIKQLSIVDKFITLSIEGQNDYRQQISKIVVESNCGLLTIRQKEMDLEEMFARATKSER